MIRETWDVLQDVIAAVRCKPRWSFAMRLDDKEAGPRLAILVMDGEDARVEGGRISVAHFFPIPIATYNRASWRRWIFECCRKVEDHELGEWFRDGDERPFAPLHGPGEDPYTVHEFRPQVDARTNQHRDIE